MHGTRHGVGHLEEARGQGVDPECESVVYPAGEYRLVHLDVGTTGVGQCSNLGVDGPGQIGDERRAVAVVAVNEAVGHRQRSRHGDLDRVIGGGLGDPPVVGKKCLAGSHRLGHGWQDRG